MPLGSGVRLALATRPHEVHDDGRDVFVGRGPVALIGHERKQGPAIVSDAFANRACRPGRLTSFLHLTRSFEPSCGEDIVVASDPLS
jgi:hypothetical protein